MRTRRVGAFAAAVTCLALIVSACSSSGSSGSSGSPGAGSSPPGGPHRGGSLVVLERAGFQGDWAAGLDPATSASAVSSRYQAIFGGLFLLRADEDGSNAEIVPNQASAGSLSDDGKTLTITLRTGITFSDGTPLDAKAVIWNVNRDTASTCTCAPKWQVRKKDPFTSPDPLTVVVHLSEPNVALLHNLPALNVNWIVSPTAFRKMGQKAFLLKPVGAGPFTVVFRFSSTSPYTGVKDPHLDQLLQQAVSSAVDSERDQTYQELAKYISDKAYSLFGFEVPRANAAVKGVHAPGLTTRVPPLSANPQVVWSEAWTQKG